MKTAKKRLLSAVRAIKRSPALVAMALITFYRWVISPLTPSSCRFHPTCSEYGLEAIRRFGFFRGTKLAASRILRCRPGGPYGYDPVPEKGADGKPVRGTRVQKGI